MGYLAVPLHAFLCVFVVVLLTTSRQNAGADDKAPTPEQAAEAIRAAVRAHEYSKALELLQRVLKMKEDLGDKPGVAEALEAVGNTYEALGDHAKAINFLQRALREAERLRAKERVASCLRGLAAAYLASDRPREGLAAAIRAVDEVGTLAGGLCEEEGAEARSR